MVPAHILQVAYYPTLRETRAELLERAGYRVTSVLGNDDAMEVGGAVMAATDLVVVGFSTSHSVRAAMVHWFKAHYPTLPVLVLQLHSWERFPEADAATLSEDPAIWLSEVARILKS